MFTNEDVNYNKGDIVNHLLYGKGVVIDVVGDFVSIAFAKNYGVKKIMKNHKNLKKI